MRGSENARKGAMSGCPRKDDGFEVLRFDVMRRGMFVKTYRYRHRRGVPLDMGMLRIWVEDRLPSLKGEDWTIEF